MGNLNIESKLAAIDAEEAEVDARIADRTAKIIDLKGKLNKDNDRKAEIVIIRKELLT
jgi:hypothetical protein